MQQCSIIIEERELSVFLSAGAICQNGTWCASFKVVVDILNGNGAAEFIYVRSQIAPVK